MKNDIVKIFATAVISTMITVGISFFSKDLPQILPYLNQIPAQIFLKAILILSLLLLLSVVLVIYLLLNEKPKRPIGMNGRKFGLSWIAEINYDQKYLGIGIIFLCPKHETRLEDKQAENSQKHVLYCEKCKKIHNVQNKGAVIYHEELYELVRSDIKRKINWEIGRS